jgi:hypothetical protein
MAEEVDTSITEEHVARAEAEAAEAAELVSTLEKRVASGDDSVTADEIEAQTKVSRFAQLRAKGTAAKAEKARLARRLAEATALHDEINAYSSNVGKKLAKHLQTMAEAEAAFLAECDVHNYNVSSWKKRAEDLGIPESDGRPVPPAEDGRLAIGRGAVAVMAGRRQLHRIEGRNFLKPFYERPSNRDTLIAGLAKVDTEIPLPEATHFYRSTQTGAYFSFDRPASENELSNGLVEVSREEAWGE